MFFVSFRRDAGMLAKLGIREIVVCLVLTTRLR